MSPHISFPAFHYEWAYLGALKIEINNNIVKLSITSNRTALFRYVIGNNTEEINVPVSHLGTYAVRINYNAIRNELIKWGRENKALGDDTYPILFTFNKDYGTYGTSENRVAVLNGIAVSPEGSNAEGNYLLIIRSPSSQRTENGWETVTTCMNNGRRNTYYRKNNENRCWLFSFIIINEDIKNRLINAAENARDTDAGRSKGVRYEVIVETSAGRTNSRDVDLYVSALRNVRTFLRAFPLIDFDSFTGCHSNGVLQLCSGDLEYIYVGSQIVVKCETTRNCMSWLRSRREWKAESYYFISPMIISYPVEMPESSTQQSQNVTLPKDSILRTGVVKFSISDFTWDKAVKLINWLWDRHRDAVFKLFLNRVVISTIASLIGANGFNYIEYFVKTTLYGKDIMIYSPNINSIINMYNSINVSNNIIDVITQLLQEVGVRLEDEHIELLRKRENEVKRALSVFALAYGLHGISHLLMKSLTALTGITDYTEFVKINVDTSPAPNLNETYETFSRGLVKDSLQKNGVDQNKYHENLFEIVPDSKFDLSAYVVSRVPYSYGVYKNRLIDNGNLRLDDIKAELRKILSRDGNDACEKRWRIEKDVLIPHRNILINNQTLLSNQVTQGTVLSAADAYISDYLNPNARFRPPRSLFRFLYERYIRRGILDELRQQGIRVQQLGRVIDTNVQYLWPNYLPQCVDGCYGCVLIERSVRSMTCDLSPLVQELKISKWSALCLLKHAGLIDEPWVDCDLS
jgi:hypothetical protein